MNIKRNITDLIGNTPLIALQRLKEEYGLYGNLLAKVEYFNVTGSIKDRIAKKMIENAEESGCLKKGGTIIEPTSGNTGIGLAAVGVSKGYRVIIVMPDTFSLERRQLIRAYGAEVVLSEGKKGMRGAIELANHLKEEIQDAYIPQQFENESNWKAHYQTTGPEIIQDTDHHVDIFISAVGTGGTITGVGKYLKEQCPNCQIIAVEPDSSPVLSGGNPGPHQIQGIGAGFIPSVLDTTIYNEIIRVTNQDAIQTAVEIGKKEGLFVGISSGAALFAAIEVAKRKENQDKNIVVILPDSGSRYLSTGYYGEE